VALGACTSAAPRAHDASTDASTHASTDASTHASTHAGTDAAAGDGALDEGVSLTFRKITLHRDFVCEGAAIGDLDRDGDADVIAGPTWYEGPDFTEPHALWPAMTFDVLNYSNCFFQWTRDVDGDGWLDVIVVGFPGQDASWLKNPGQPDASWARSAIAEAVDTESPELLDVVGDDAPELLFAAGGKLTYATPSSAPSEPWVLHAISDDRGFVPFTHGLGSADIDGDGRKDVLEATGFWQQPSVLTADPVWVHHAHAFGAGGAQMLGDDVEGDGDMDVITTHSAHGYGLSWFEQQPDGAFTEHAIVPSSAPASIAEVIAHEPHALAMADLDGDGLRDLILGERHWGHVPEGEADFAAPARLYWLRLVRDANGSGSASYVPQLIDDDSGVGTQIAVGDVNGDEHPDIVIANKKGAFVFVQER
jgi:hypothetical protein